MNICDICTSGLVPCRFALLSASAHTEKNGFVTTKLGTTNNFFVTATKNFAAATKRIDRREHFVIATKYFCYPYFNK